jgi:hypothetical protein
MVLRRIDVVDTAIAESIGNGAKWSSTRSGMATTA